MKRLFNITAIVASLAISLSACNKDYLEINNNPNSAISSTPELVLPAALTSTAGLVITYHDFGSYVNGYQANAFGYSYTGSVVYTYNYTSADNNGLYTGAFGNLRSYQYIINQSNADKNYVLYNSVARIMKSYLYQNLVDEYGDVPYTEGLQGTDNLTPKFDKAEAVYQGCVADINLAITQLKANLTNTAVRALGTHDIMFNGDLTKWIKFANNIKLRLLVRAQGSSIDSFVNTAYGTFSTEGFLTEDALINPGYSSSTANQNPMWNTYHSDYIGTATGTGRSRVPSNYVVSFYNGAKLSDTRRGLLVYRSLTAPLNQLGNEPSTAAASQPVSGYPAWYIGTGTGTSASEAQGILKSRIMSQPIMLAAETHFLLAEAALKGHAVAGTALANFNSGIVASFNYLEKLGSTNAVPSTSNPTADATAYQTNNSGSYLVNYGSALNDNQRLEAIITQKYIALNFIHAHESWTEFRRTGYPVTAGASGTAITSFSSIFSVSPRADKLPVRLLYPQNEINLNSNTPTGLSPFTSRIFWDIN